MYCNISGSNPLKLQNNNRGSEGERSDLGEILKENCSSSSIKQCPITSSYNLSEHSGWLTDKHTQCQTSRINLHRILLIVGLYQVNICYGIKRLFFTADNLTCQSRKITEILKTLTMAPLHSSVSVIHGRYSSAGTGGSC